LCGQGTVVVIIAKGAAVSGGRCPCYNHSTLRKFYITNAIPYVNAAPHIGHALEFVQTDVLARFHRALGEDVFYLSGADENALKNVLAAEEAGVTVAEFVTQNTRAFAALRQVLDLSYDDFILTSDRERHWPGVEKLWQACLANGDIYQKDYEGLYCVGCEEFKTEKDLVGGLCPEHGKTPELVREKNYFFRLSKYQEKLEQLIASDSYRIVPETRKNEVLAFIRSGLTDFSISRSKERARGWGIPVPGDDSQIIYVWYDALANYITALGYAEEAAKFQKYWPADVHVVGKGITRFHAVYWPAMLLSAGLPLPKALFVHGYLTAEGQKISKSLGNVIDPGEIGKEYGSDTLRYYLLRAFSPFEDGDFSPQRLEETYSADLANGLGNLVSRIASLCERSNLEFRDYKPQLGELLSPELCVAMDNFEFHRYLELVWAKISALDRFIDERKPWELLGKASAGNARPRKILESGGLGSAGVGELAEVLGRLVIEVRELAVLVAPFIPQAAEKIAAQFRPRKIESAAPLFPRR